MTVETIYKEFLEKKRVEVKASGFDVSLEMINPNFFLFQKDITRWALHLGCAAVFANVGMGKTRIQLEWARWINFYTKRPVLILSPLAVAPQTVLEGEKIGIAVKRVFAQSDVGDAPIVITNYDNVHKFDVSQFSGVVLDESSVLKHYSKTFFALTELFAQTPYKLCCTATPSPNDIVEIGNHAMFLGIMHFKDMLARWFVGEGDVARRARLKKHAEGDFWRWLTGWAVCISKPSDLGEQYDMPGYELPPLSVIEHRLKAPQASIDRAWAKGQLLPDDSSSATQFHQVKRESLSARVETVEGIFTQVPESDPFITWCHTDYEANALKKAFPKAIEVRGSQTPGRKEKLLTAFSEGKERHIITKPTIAGMGLNWQHCNWAAYVGVDFSFETTFQSMGRIHRYGQKRDVRIDMVYAETEGSVLQILQSKQVDFIEMQAKMSAALREHGLFRGGNNMTVFTESGFSKAEGKDWTFYEGDCVKVMAKLPVNTVDMTITSIPFGKDLYTYSDKQADVGNAETHEEFWSHMAFVIQGLHRITRPGRCCAVHVKDLPLFQNRDGAQGIYPFSDDTTAAFRDLWACECGWAGSLKSLRVSICPVCEKQLSPGWVLQSRVTVEKDPVIEMEKTNSHGLLYKNWRERAELLRTGLPDYILIFQKPGDDRSHRVLHDPNDETYFGDNPPKPHEWLHLPTRAGRNNYNLPVWQKIANPHWSDVDIPSVWDDINQTLVLNSKIAKEDKDERHLAPLQLDLIARLIHWKSNPGDTVFDPFGGIGSTLYEALKQGRKGLGSELKPEYHKWGVRYLKELEIELGQATLFDLLEEKQAEMEITEVVP